jgi:hypothetical protein
MRWCVLKVNRFAALNTWRLSCDSINKMESISLLCPVHHKEREQLNYVCLHRGCGAELLCHECLVAHRDHYAPNLHRFVDLAEEMLYDRTLADRKKAIKHGKAQFRAKTGQIREEIGRQLAEAEAAADRFFDEADARLTALQTKEEAAKLRLFAVGPKPAEKLAEEVRQLRGDFLAKQQIRVEFADAIAKMEADAAQRTNCAAEIMAKQLLP